MGSCGFCPVEGVRLRTPNESITGTFEPPLFCRKCQAKFEELLAKGVSPAGALLLTKTRT